jgi:hypothetical protein
MMTQTAMTEKSFAPMTTIDQILRIDSAQYPSGKVLPFAFGAQSKTRIPIPLSTRCPPNFSDSAIMERRNHRPLFGLSASRKIIPYKVFRALSYSPESDESIVSHTTPSIAEKP